MTAAPVEAPEEAPRLLGRRLAQSPPSVPLLPSGTDPLSGAPPGAQIVTTTTTGAFPSDAQVKTSTALGGIATTCDKYDPGTGEWARDPSVRYDASGGSTPDAQAVSKLVQTICNGTAREAGKQVLDGIQAGGSQADVAVAALFQQAPSQCSNAGDDAYVTAADAVNTGAVADLQATQAFFTNLVAAANSVGLPMCMSIAVLDKEGKTVLDSFEYHTGTAL
ncbi:carotenoid oxygenase [Micractinium conductrix]|uniref:Carotenoid oxygenase n=1 Tax=Micractinium conductrix TaxID=554055 RepID=A0A2P6VSI0_9CHLO|nr:carotenoid oxygenase [Micractinium conductrix]|eukprot:PSC77051.1 carotenoid oxygenase [Micractinium conductrix]